jgi:hypothetical protein
VSVIMLSGIMLSVIMLSVVMTSVLALLDLITDFESDATIITLQNFRHHNEYKILMRKRL